MFLYDKSFKTKFAIFLKEIHREDQIKIIDAIISCDGDKVDQYLIDTIPDWWIVSLYFIRKNKPYSEYVSLYGIAQWLYDIGIEELGPILRRIDINYTDAKKSEHASTQ